jgi:hypothetical protein
MALLKFDDSRIKDHPDKDLLEKIRVYFHAFTTGSFDEMKDLQSEVYTMTDIRKNNYIFPISFLDIAYTRHPASALGVVNVNREDWYNINKNFVSLMEDLSVVAIKLDGSSAPGSFSTLEHAVKFKLTSNPPPQAARNLPPGAKAGDTVGMINISVLYWDEQGKVSRELEYGRLTWENFSVGEFDPK